jgi:hypothetical protein
MLPYTSIKMHQCPLKIVTYKNSEWYDLILLYSDKIIKMTISRVEMEEKSPIINYNSVLLAEE